jgi:hypothetical protein
MMYCTSSILTSRMYSTVNIHHTCLGQYSNMVFRNSTILYLGGQIKISNYFFYIKLANAGNFKNLSIHIFCMLLLVLLR